MILVYFASFVTLSMFLSNIQCCPTQCDCREDKMYCERVRLTETDLQDMILPPQVTEAHFINNNLNEISQEALRNFKDVSVLEISNNGLKNLSNGIFVGFNNLKNLILNGNELTELTQEMFSGLINLRRLEIRRNQITDLSPGLFNRLYFLQIVRFQSNRIEIVRNGVFTKLKWLRDIWLSGNRITTIEDKAFQNLTMNILSLADNKLKTVPVTAFKGLSIAKKILLLLNPLDCECENAMNYAVSFKHLTNKIWGYCATPDYAMEQHVMRAHISMLCTLCDLNPCQNGGKCLGNKTHVDCKCPEKFRGGSCEISICNDEVKYITKIVQVPGKTIIKYVDKATNIPIKQNIVNRTEYIVIKEKKVNADDQQKLKILYAMCTLEFVVILCLVGYFGLQRYRDFKLRKKYEHEKSRKILLNIRNTTNAKLAKSLCDEEGNEEFPFDVKNMLLKGAVPV